MIWLKLFEKPYKITKESKSYSQHGDEVGSFLRFHFFDRLLFTCNYCLRLQIDRIEPLPGLCNRLVEL